MDSIQLTKALLDASTEKYIALHGLLPPFVFLFFDSLFYIFLYMGFAISLVYLVMAFSAATVKAESKEEVLDKSKAPFVTIQIPTRNEIIALRCVKKCLNFDYPKDKYEILIGDDSNDESVSARLKEFASKHSKVRVIKRKENTGFKPGNLNNMLKHSKGEILVIFDSDFVPGKDFLKRIVAPFKNKEVSAVQARWKFINDDKNVSTALGSTIVYTFHQVTLSILKKFDIGFLCGSAEAIRKEDLIESGGWKSGSLTEDIEYSLRLHQKGKKIVYLPKLECYNEAPSKPMDLYKQQMRWAYGVISSYKAHSKGILTSNLSAGKKMITMIGSFGYIFPIVLLMICLTGSLSFMTHDIGPLDLGKFAFETSRNIVLTAGLLVSSSFALYKAKKIKLIPKMLLSSFSVGLITTYYVNVGIAKAIFNKPMEWYLLKKSTKV